MSVDYNSAPYNLWAKCPHTCGHAINNRDSQRPTLVKNIVYNKDGVNIPVLSADHIFPAFSSSLAQHASKKPRHPSCKAGCPGHLFLTEKGVNLRTATTSVVRRNLTEDDWKTHGISICILNSLNNTIQSIPDEYYQQALPILQERLPQDSFQTVLDKRNKSSGREETITVFGADVVLENFDQSNISVVGPGAGSSAAGSSSSGLSQAQFLS